MKINKVIIVSFLLSITCSLIYGSEVLLPASQIEQGKGSLSLLYSNSEDKINFTVNNRDEIKVNNASTFSDVNNNLESTGKNSTIALKMILNPHSNLYYWVKAGVGSYDLEIPSITVKNKLSGRDKGWVFGLGVHKNLFPDTIVTPAVAFELGLNYSSFKLDTFKNGDSAPVLISDTLTLTELQFACLMSKNYKKFEPYGGFKVLRTYAVLQDNSTTGKVDGIKDNYGLFFGTKIKIYPKENIVVEGSFLGETSLSVAWNLGF